jgi:hypothetical protein
MIMMSELERQLHQGVNTGGGSAFNRNEMITEAWFGADLRVQKSTNGLHGSG